MSSSPFVHLHLHSQYSLLDGAIKINPLFERAKALNMPAVALTDHGNLFGAVEFYESAREAGIKPRETFQHDVPATGQHAQTSSPVTRPRRRVVELRSVLAF